MAADTAAVSGEQPAKKAFTAKSLTIHLYSIGNITDTFLYVPFGFLVVPIFTLEFGLSPIWIGWAMALPRLIDGFLDPVWANWSDSCKSRLGRRRPFILASTVIGMFVIAGMWWASPNWSPAALFLWLLVANLVIFSLYGIFDTTHQALGFELSDDFNQRARVQAIRGFYASLLGLIPSLYMIAVWLAHPESNTLSIAQWLGQHNSKGWLDVPIAMLGGLARWFARHESWFGNGINGMRWVGAGMGLLALVAGLVVVVACRERFKWAARTKRGNIWHSLKATLHVRAFVVVLLLQFATTIGGMLWQQISFFICVFSLCAGMKEPKVAAGFLGMPASYLSFALGFAMMYLAAPICKLIGKRAGIIISYGIGALNAILLPFFMRPGQYWVYIGFTLALLPLQMLGGTFGSAIMPDICDIDELRTGERHEALFIAVLNWMSKLQNSIITVIAGYFLVWIGFDQKAAVQAPGVMERMRFWGFGMMILGSVLAFVISWWMPITAKQMAEVRAKLDERHHRMHVDGASEGGSAEAPALEEGETGAEA
jgi:GPH family glycoside/pentoside/hexuronide:cation symporter